jgi:hypothetical protein
MENNQLPAEQLPTDLTDEDMQRIDEFVRLGSKGLDKVTDDVLRRMLDLYLTGCTYEQIQSFLRISKGLVLYLSHTYNWYAIKAKHLKQLNDNISSRLTESELVSKEFLMLLNQTYQKKLSGQLRRYLSTGEDSHLEEIDFREVDKIFKTIEMIKEINNEQKAPKGRSPAIGLNVGSGVKVERSGENELTITPQEQKEKTFSELRKEFADRRRAEEDKEKPVKKHDITENKEQEDEE